MKTKYYVIVGTIVVALIGGILLVRSGISPSASPSATVKAFYKALNKGDISRAENYLSFAANLRSIASILSRGHDTISLLESLTGKIQEVKILREYSWEFFGQNGVAVQARVILKPKVQEQAKIEAEKQLGKGLSGLEFQKILFIGYFPEKQEWVLVKEGGKWKIADLGRFS